MAAVQTNTARDSVSVFARRQSQRQSQSHRRAPIFMVGLMLLLSSSVGAAAESSAPTSPELDSRGEAATAQDSAQDHATGQVSPEGAQRSSLRGTGGQIVAGTRNAAAAAAPVPSGQNQPKEVQEVPEVSEVPEVPEVPEIPGVRNQDEAQSSNPSQSRDPHSGEQQAEEMIRWESEVQQLAALPMSVFCVCEKERGDLHCGSLFYSLLQCNPSCAAICHGKGMAMNGCTGVREVGWYQRLHYKYIDCKGSPLQS